MVARKSGSFLKMSHFQCLTFQNKIPVMCQYVNLGSNYSLLSLSLTQVLKAVHGAGLSQSSTAVLIRLW